MAKVGLPILDKFISRGLRAFSSSKKGIIVELRIMFFSLEKASNIFAVLYSRVNSTVSTSMLKFISLDKNKEIIGSNILLNI